MIALWIGWIMVGCLVTCGTPVAWRRYRKSARIVVFARSGLVPVIFAAVPATVRSRVGCVGENSGSSGDNSAAGQTRHAGSARRRRSSGDKSAAVHNITGIAGPTGAIGR